MLRVRRKPMFWCSLICAAFLNSPPASQVRTSQPRTNRSVSRSIVNSHTRNSDTNPSVFSRWFGNGSVKGEQSWLDRLLGREPETVPLARSGTAQTRRTETVTYRRPLTQALRDALRREDPNALVHISRQSDA